MTGGSTGHTVSTVVIPKPTLRRMPTYLNLLKRKYAEGMRSISSTVVSGELGLNNVQVRKDFAFACIGRPKTGYDIGELVESIEGILGCNNTKDAVLVGVGRLGGALLSYDGFTGYGLNIVAAFDIAAERSDAHGAKSILPMSELPRICKSLNIMMGIITVPAGAAQATAELLVDCGIRAIWNFAPTHLTLPEHVIVQNECVETSLAVLSKKLQTLKENYKKEQIN